MRKLLSALLVLLVPTFVEAQAIAPPTGPVLFCGTQNQPVATSYELVFNGGTPEPLNMDTAVHSQCPAGRTHSFQLPASRFPIGEHKLIIRANNQFGSTSSTTAYTVVVGIAPGEFTINDVFLLPSQPLATTPAAKKPAPKKPGGGDLEKR